MAKKVSQLDDIELLSGEEEALVSHEGHSYKFKLKKVKQLVTKEDLDIENVDNTSDLDKPISTATQSALNNKSNTNHQHHISDVTNLSNILNDKAPLVHSHILDDVDGLDTALASKSEVGHGHNISDVTNLSIELDNKANLSHTHSKSDVIGLNNDLNTIQLSLENKTDIGHTHTVADIVDLDSHLDEKLEDYVPDVTVNKLEW